MFIFGHLGIGKKLLDPFSKGLPTLAILIGTLLPDVIDKSLFYGQSLLVEKTSFTWTLISGTRSIGHTALFLILLSLTAFIKRSRFLAALSLGIATHLMLDGLADAFSLIKEKDPSISHVILWPLKGLRFPSAGHKSIKYHFLSRIKEPSILWGEIIGLSLLLWDYRPILMRRGSRSHGPK